MIWKKVHLVEIKYFFYRSMSMKLYFKFCSQSLCKWNLFSIDTCFVGRRKFLVLPIGIIISSALTFLLQFPFKAPACLCVLASVLKFVWRFNSYSILWYILGHSPDVAIVVFLWSGLGCFLADLYESSLWLTSQWFSIFLNYCNCFWC